MKKFLAVLSTLVLLVSLVACGTSQTAVESGAELLEQLDAAASVTMETVE